MRVFSVFCLTLLCSGLSAHEGQGLATFQTGLAHPFGGWDHLLAMVAVGLLAARHGGQWRWRLPLIFVVGLAIGGGLGVLSIGLPAVEMTIALSVLAFGLLLSCGTRLSPWLVLSVVAVAGLPHGHAHLAEAGSGSPFGYGLGMVLGSILLHGFGLLGALAIGRAHLAQDRWQLVAGPAIAAAGLALSISL